MGGFAWYVFAGGGTGGHLYPALAVARELQTGPEAGEVSFFCTQRPIDRQILGQAGIEAVPLPIRPFPARPWDLFGFWSSWRRSVQLCMDAFRRRRPAAVVGAGGYASGPPVHAAVRLGIPTFVLNPDAVPGRANRYLARHRRLAGIFAQWEVTRRYFPPGAPVAVTGCPVRPEFRSISREAARDFIRSVGLDANRPILLVTGASQGARTINQAMVRLAGVVAGSGWQILHLSGPADEAEVNAAYASAAGGVAAGGLGYRVLAFTDRMAEALAAADLVVSRAGASTLSELQASGRPSILLPYPYHRDLHQRHNGEVLVRAGAAVLLDDARDPQVNAGRLEPVLRRLMADADARRAMGEAARGLDRPEAASEIARHLRGAAAVSSGDSGAARARREPRRERGAGPSARLSVPGMQPPASGGGSRIFAASPDTSSCALSESSFNGRRRPSQAAGRDSILERSPRWIRM